MRKSLSSKPLVSLVLCLSLGVFGCAGLMVSGDGGPEVRPDAPPEYDVLVAHEHENAGDADSALAAYERAVAKDEDSAFLQRKVAEGLWRAERLDDALVHAQRARELDPDDTAARTLLAQIFRVKRDVPAAEAVLNDAAGDPIDADAAFLLYQVYLENDRAEDSLGVAQAMAERDPYDLRAHVALANAYQRLERPTEAEDALRDAIDIAPRNLRLYSALARSLRERGERDGEIEVYRTVLSRHPDHHGTLVALAEAQMSENDLEGAIGTLEEVERRYPSDLRTTLRIGFLKYEAHEFEDAAERFEKVHATKPDDHEITFFLGIVRRRLNQEDQALEAFGRIPSGHKHYPESRTQMAAIHERRRDYGLALKSIERALGVKPNRMLELYSATLRAKAGDFDGAVSYLQQLLAREPENDEIYYNLGLVYGEQKRTGEAIEFMQQALEHNPENASALNYIGYSWAEGGERLDDAEAMIVRAIELRPEDGYIVDSLGWVYHMRALSSFEAGRTDEAQAYVDRAVAELERAHELTGGDPVISEHLGDTYLLLDEKRRALDKFEEAVDLGPRTAEQPNLLEKLENLRREFKGM